MARTWTRRDFAATLLAGGSSLKILNVAACDEPAPAATAPEPATPTTDAPQPAEVEPEIEDLLLVALLRRYPMPQLTAERLRGMRSGISRNLRSGETLRAGLRNSDEPATVFRYRRWDH